MSECAPRRARGQQQLPHCRDLTKEDLSKTSSSLWNNMLPTVRLMLVIWQNCLLHHDAAGCWHSHHGVSVISSHPGRWKVVYIETERQYHMVAPGDRIWWELIHIKWNNSLFLWNLNVLFASDIFCEFHATFCCSHVWTTVEQNIFHICTFKLENSCLLLLYCSYVCKPPRRWFKGESRAHNDLCSVYFGLDESGGSLSF